jgi:alkaline phosphatase
MKYLLISFVMLGAVACTTNPDKQGKAPARPDNIIFLIGDGMGLSAVSTGIYYRDRPSSFERFRTIGLQKTYSASHKVTDSAASGTALASGIKTYNGMIGMDTLKNAVTNISELVSGLGWNTGVVATSTITHATPASFYAHIENRGMEEAIADQLLESGIDFFAGGGIDRFNHRKDGKDLFPLAVEKGFMIDTTALKDAGSLEPESKYGFLLAKGGMPPAAQGRDEFLTDATKLAIAYLSGSHEPFFLMVEGSQIDWAGHANNSEYLISETLDFENVIDAVLDFAEKDGKTLVVVTADHETGGFTLSEGAEYGSSNPGGLSPTFATGGHSATLIPVFAYGPGAEEFTGIFENTEIFHKMAALAKGE